MQREIKFRAYNREHRDMYPVYSFSRDYVFKDNLDGIGTPGHPDEPTDVHLMQYTGMKDVNGVEIYEGDIVKWGMLNSYSQECWHRYAVVEINPDIQFRIIYYIDSKTGQLKPTDNHIFEFGSFAYAKTEKHLEVIGNMYEHTHLLTDPFTGTENFA